MYRLSKTRRRNTSNAEERDRCLGLGRDFPLSAQWRLEYVMEKHCGVWGAREKPLYPGVWRGWACSQEWWNGEEMWALSVGGYERLWGRAKRRAPSISFRMTEII